MQLMPGAQKKCEVCHEKTANYGIVGCTPSKRWCHACADAYPGACNPRRRDLAARARQPDSESESDVDDTFSASDDDLPSGVGLGLCSSSL